MSRVLAIFGIKLKKDLQVSIIKKQKQRASHFGRSANGNSRLSGTVTLKFDNPQDPNTLSIFMEDYWFWVNAGRKPGRVAAKADIAGWVKRTGVNPVAIIKDMNAKAGIVLKKAIPFAVAVKQFDFIVRRSLRTKGYEANHFYDEVINDGRLIQLKKDLSDEYRKEIKITINGSDNLS